MSTYIQTIYKEKNGTIQNLAEHELRYTERVTPRLQAETGIWKKKIKDENTSDALINNL